MSAENYEEEIAKLRSQVKALEAERNFARGERDGYRLLRGAMEAERDNYKFLYEELGEQQKRDYARWREAERLIRALQGALTETFPSYRKIGDALNDVLAEIWKDTK